MEDRRGAAPAASQAQRCPNTPPTPAPEAAARDPAGVRGATRSRQSYSLGSAAVPGAHRLQAPQPRARSALLRPLREPGARRPQLGREALPPPLPRPLQISWQGANSG